MILSRNRFEHKYSATVKKYQGYLNRHLSPSRITKIPVDGYFGSRTKNAVKVLQQVHFPNQKWAWDGVIGPDTAALIDRLNAPWWKRAYERITSVKVMDLRYDTRIRTGTWRSGNKQTRFTLHHSAGMADVWQDARYHIEGHGWPGLSYHIWIHQDGTVYRISDFDRITHHAKGANSTSIGVCLQGNDSITEAQKKSIKWLMHEYPEQAWQCHRDVIPTICPGVRTCTWLKSIRPSF